MHHYVGRRHGTRGRHVVLVVCRAWLQPPRTEPCRGKPVAEHVSCHVRRADTRTGHRTGQTAIGHSPSFHAKDFLCRQRFGGRGNRIENGRTIPICGRKAGKKQFRDHPFRLPRRHVERDVGMRPRYGHAQPVRFRTPHTALRPGSPMPVRRGMGRKGHPSTTRDHRAAPQRTGRTDTGTDSARCGRNAFLPSPLFMRGGQAVQGIRPAAHF